MTGRRLIRLSQLKEKMASEKLEEIDWVTFGVILKKITPQSSNSVSHFIDFSAISSQIDSGDSYVLDLLPRAHQYFIWKSLLISSQVATPSLGWYPRGRCVRRALLKEHLVVQASWAFYCPCHSFLRPLSLFVDVCRCPYGTAIPFVQGKQVLREAEFTDPLEALLGVRCQLQQSWNCWLVRVQYGILNLMDITKDVASFKITVDWGITGKLFYGLTSQKIWMLSLVLHLAGVVALGWPWIFLWGPPFPYL